MEWRGGERRGEEWKVNENRFGAPYKAPPLKGEDRRGAERTGEERKVMESNLNLSKF